MSPSGSPARAKHFYSSVFGWRFDESMPDYTTVQLGDGAPIGGGIGGVWCPPA